MTIVFGYRHLELLKHLHEIGGEASLISLSARLGMDMNNLRNAIGKLELLGLVQLTEDGRNRMVRLTESGRRLAEAIKETGLVERVREMLRSRLSR